MSDIWYYAAGRDPIGPLNLQEIKNTLPTLPNAKDVLIWRDGFTTWTRAADVPELRPGTITPPPLPTASAVSTPAETPSDAGRAEPTGIGGWLIFPILGTILAPLYTGYGALQAAQVLAQSPPAGGLTTFVRWELAFNVALTLSWAYVIISAFRHKRGYPSLFVSLVALTLAGSLIDLYVATTLFNVPFESDDAKAIVRPLLTLLIWGPYVFLSKRVKNTFVR